jgi:hypothetical protein
MEQNLRPGGGQNAASDVGIRDLKFAFTGIGICVTLAIVLMLVS